MSKVDTPSVLRVLRENVSRVKVLLLALIPELNKEDWNQTIQEHRTVAANSVLGIQFFIFYIFHKKIDISKRILKELKDYRPSYKFPPLLDW